MVIDPADLFLSPDLTEVQARDYLRTRGFRDPEAADTHLQAIADDLPARQVLGAMASLLLEALQLAPDPDAALVGFTRYVATRSPKTMLLRYLHDDPRALGVLVDVLGTSPFLGEILIRNPEYFHWLVGQLDRVAPDAADLAGEAGVLLDRIETTADRLDALKRFKRRELLRIAARDILGRETLESATGQLSDLADVVIEQALRLAGEMVCEAAGLERLPGRFLVVGMGKLGGRELNYSSDIDLLYVYDLDDEEDQAAHALFQKLGRELTRVMTEYSDESYLYRVDLRLRPMGRRGNIAYSLRQCAQYYDTWGETFERFALIKARPITGDPGLGEAFVDLVQPFVYRRYLDHAALEEMFRHKSRVERGRRDLDRDVKIGRGGIREIELFTQVLQLTYGGRNRDLRRAGTLPGLAALAEAGLVTAEVREDLVRGYIFLRTVEHRLQIVQERQTHALAEPGGELEITARRLGFESAAALQAELDTRRARVHEVYGTLFERRPGAEDFRSRQFFRILAEDASAETALAHLAEWGFPDPEATLHVIRALDEATSLAPSRSMARNVLANLLAALTERLARCAAPGQVLIRLEQVAERTGAPASFFRTLLENEALRELLVATLDLGNLPAERLVRYPELLDSLLFTLPSLDELRERYRQGLAGPAGEERLDHLRRFKALEEFKVLVDWVSDRSLGTLQERLSLLAECCVAQAADWHAPGAERGAAPDWAIVALGKLGGRELTVHSDLDLVVVYRGDPGDSETFLARQGFVEAMGRFLEQPSAEGVAYRIDTRLRPEGSKGALAIPLEGFYRYLDSRAEIWERLAWTRCRFLTGSPEVGEAVQAAVTRFVYGPWDPAVPRYMRALRERMERELVGPGSADLEFKVGRGGLADIDFLLQMIQIREGHARVEFRIAGTRELLERMPQTAYLTTSELEELRRAHALLRSLETFARVESGTNLGAVPADAAKLEALGRRLGLAEPAGPALVETYQQGVERVREIFETVLGRL